MNILVIQRLFLELLLDIIYFPLWWYTGGVKHAIKYCYGVLQSGNMFLSPMLWLKNIFVPMYGQSDFQGRLVSFFMRLVNFIGRSIALFFWIFVVIFIFLLWLAFPVFVVWMLIQSIK